MRSFKKGLSILLSVLTVMLLLSACSESIAKEDTPPDDEKVEDYGADLTKSDAEFNTAVYGLCSMYISNLDTVNYLINEKYYTEADRKVIEANAKGLLIFQALEQGLTERYRQKGGFEIEASSLDELMVVIADVYPKFYPDASETEQEAMLSLFGMLIIRDESRLAGVADFDPAEFNYCLVNLFSCIYKNTPPQLQMQALTLFYELCVASGYISPIYAYAYSDDTDIRSAAIDILCNEFSKDTTSILAYVLSEEENEQIRQEITHTLLSWIKEQGQALSSIYSARLISSLLTEENEQLLQETVPVLTDWIAEYPEILDTLAQSWQYEITNKINHKQLFKRLIDLGIVPITDLALFCDSDEPAIANQFTEFFSELTDVDTDPSNNIFALLLSTDDAQYNVAFETTYKAIWDDMAYALNLVDFYLTLPPETQTTFADTVLAINQKEPFFDYLVSQMMEGDHLNVSQSIEQFLFSNDTFSSNTETALQQYFETNAEFLNDYAKSMLMSLVYGKYSFSKYHRYFSSAITQSMEDGSSFLSTVDLSKSTVDCLYDAFEKAYELGDDALRKTVGDYVILLLNFNDYHAITGRLFGDAIEVRNSDPDYARHLWYCLKYADGEEHIEHLCYFVEREDPEELINDTEYFQLIDTLQSLATEYEELDAEIYSFIKTCIQSAGYSENAKRLRAYYLEDFAQVKESPCIASDAHGVALICYNADTDAYSYNHFTDLPKALTYTFPQEVRYVILYTESYVYDCEYTYEGFSNVRGYRTDVTITIIDKLTGKETAQKYFRGLELPNTLSASGGGWDYHHDADTESINTYVDEQVAIILNNVQ